MLRFLQYEYSPHDIKQKACFMIRDSFYSPEKCDVS